MERKLGGGAAGNFTVKSCGKSHAWCSQCMGETHPNIVNAEYKRRNKVVKPCGNCKRCNDCLGIIAQNGFKVCMGCKQELQITLFKERKPGIVVSRCKYCVRRFTPIGLCTVCNKIFINNNGRAGKACQDCKEELLGSRTGHFRQIELALNIVTCLGCSIEFKPDIHNKKYCSKDCEESNTVIKNNKNKRQKNNQKDNRRELLEYYSNGFLRCACCYDEKYNELQLDHINGDGKQHRKELGGNSFNVLYSWVVKNNYPPIFQLLCSYCNRAKFDNLECPYKDNRCAHLRIFWSSRTQ